MRAGTALTSLLFVSTLLLGVTNVGGHGASKGLHLHLSPDPAAPGERITVEVTAAEDVTRVRIGFVDQKPLERRFDPPRRRFEIGLKVPADVSGDSVSCHAEVQTSHGKTLRASAVLRAKKGTGK